MLAPFPSKRMEATDATRGVRPARLRGTMHWVRRIHLYTGLFMFPWVMLYSVTALLFNHPAVFSDRPARTLSLGDFQNTPLERVADPSGDAERIVAALNARFAGETSQSPLRLLDPKKARYTRDRISARVRGEGAEHSVTLDLPSGTAYVLTDNHPPAERAPFATRGLKAPGVLGERVKTGLPIALSRQGLAAEEAGIAVGTDLIFFVEVEGRAWRATYNIQTGSVTGVPAESPPKISPRGFLTQLHLAHGYPTCGGVRWLWALGVDAMFVSMVFWGVSGLLMFWQVKAVRRPGAVVTALGLAAALLLACAMLHEFTH